MTSPAAPPPANPTRRRWLKGLLIASLALNALVIGVVLRSVWHMRSANALAGVALEARLPGFVGTLPRDRQEALRSQGLVDRPRTLRPLRLELRRARGEAARAFTADPFDAQVFATAQAAVLDAEIKLRRAVQEMMPRIAEQMTVQERRAFIRWRGPGFGPGRGPGGPRRDGSGRGGEPDDGAGQDERPGGRRPP